MKIVVKLVKASALLRGSRMLREDVTPPIATLGNVGLDVRCDGNYYLKPHLVTKIHTGLILADAPLSDDGVTVFLKIEGRSGLASKGIFPVGGIIDPSYRGEIIVLMYNGTDEHFYLEDDDRVAQLVCYCVPEHVKILIVGATEIEGSSRGEKGFGSSGR